MKKLLKGIFITPLLLLHTVSADRSGASFFLGHTGNICGNGLLTPLGKKHLPDSTQFFSSFTTHVEIANIFLQDRFAKNFSMKDSDTFRVGPPRTSFANEDTDVMNLSFLLQEDFKSTVTLVPKGSAFTTAFTIFFDLSPLIKKGWVEVDAKIIYNKQEIEIKETVHVPNNPAGFSGTTKLFTNAGGGQPAYSSFKEALRGDKTLSNGTATKPMAYGKVDGPQSGVKVGDITIALGWDLWREKSSHLGVALLGRTNGGGTTKATYFFEPTFGTQGYQGGGIRIEGHALLHETETTTFSFFGKVQSIFFLSQIHKRTYDFARHGRWSRYMLCKEWSSLGAANPLPNSLVQANTFTTLRAHMRVEKVWNIDFIFRYTCGNITFDYGYGMWGGGNEKIISWVDDINGFYGAADTNNASSSTTLDGVGNPINNNLSTDVTITGGNSQGAISTAIAPPTTKTILSRDLLYESSGRQVYGRSDRLHCALLYTWKHIPTQPFLCAGTNIEICCPLSNHIPNQWGMHIAGGVNF